MWLTKCVINFLFLHLAFSCEDGWTLFEKHCYKTFSQPQIQKSFANNFCMNHGATLTSVLSENERQFLVDLTHTNELIVRRNQPVIGAYRESVKLPWKWYDGSPFTQMNFFTQAGLPHNGKADLYLALMGNRYKENLPLGSFVDVENGPATLFICKKKDTGNSSVYCGERWTSFGTNCYRRLSMTAKIDCADLNVYCNTTFGATLATVTTDQERRFIIEYAKTGRAKLSQLQPIIGGFRNSENSPFQWFDETPFTQHSMFCPKQPSSKVKGRHCMRIKADDSSANADEGAAPGGCIYNYMGPRFAANSFICKRKIPCDAESQIEKDGKCACKPDFIDIVDSEHLEAKNYSRGQKCVKKGKCHSIKDKTSILFIIDSSESITAKHWPKMINFVKQGANELPNSFRIGFMKFSNKVSENKWLEPNWTKSEYHNTVPVEYEKGQTNTPLALQEARKMFENDGNKLRIAVLITDGMPVAQEYESKEDALKATTKAAKALQKEGVRLTVMGVGPELLSGINEVKEWVKNPRKDYFSFVDTVDCLKESDIDRLLQIVCDFSN